MKESLRLVDEFSRHLDRYSREEQGQILHAAHFAAQRHLSQKRESGERYLIHPLAVAQILVETNLDAPTIIAAVLHDVLEDTTATVAELTMVFGAVVASAVLLVTDPEGETRRTRKTALHTRLLGLDVNVPAMRLALLVKAADRLANVRACMANHPSKLSMYRKEHTVFRPATYRPGVCDTVWAELDSLLELLP